MKVAHIATIFQATYFMTQFGSILTFLAMKRVTNKMDALNSST